MSCLCGHPQAQHDPEDKVCDAHATEGLGRCPCPGFVPDDEVQLRVAWNRAGLYDLAARERRQARDERDLYRKECERLREQLHDQLMGLLRLMSRDDQKEEIRKIRAQKEKEG